MTATISRAEFDLIREFIRRETSISLSGDKVYLVETRLREIMRNEGVADFSELHRQLQAGGTPRLRDLVIDAMTTNETLWFRDRLPFDVFRDCLLPAYAAEIKEGTRRNIRIWCAACSSGQEPYSLVMTFLEAARRNSALDPEQLEILATDLSDSALATARNGRYGGMAMDRGMSADLRDRYFQPDGDAWRVQERLQERIVFRKFNLQDSFIMMGSFDIILTRYVLIYFDEVFKREVLRKAHGALADKGILFLGSSESLPPQTPGFSLIRAGRATYFQKSSSVPDLPAPLAPAAPPPAPIVPVDLANPGGDQGGELAKATEDLSEIRQRLHEMNEKQAARRK